MSIDTHIKPWTGHAFRHIPDIDATDIRDFRYCHLSETNRWNTKGEPTLYLAKDRSVAIGEFARHFSEERSSILANKLIKRQIWKLSVHLTKTVDLCSPDVCKSLSLSDHPYCFEDIQIARSTASFLRNTLKIQAIFVPSMVFIDDLSKWCLVVFLENVPNDPLEFIPRVEKRGYLKIQ